MISRAPRITKRKHDSLLKCFAIDITATKAAQIAKVHRQTANRWYLHWREIIYSHMRRAPRFFGEIEIDQAYFQGRAAKRETALVRRLAGLDQIKFKKETKKVRKGIRKIQVFGVLQRNGNVYTQIVRNEKAETLIPIIRLVVEQNSTIYTDMWPSFNGLGLDGYTHHTINHSLGYSDRRGKHLNGIEAFWSFCKGRSGRLNQFIGISRRTFPLHLKECEFRYNNKNILPALKKILAANSLPVSKKKRRA